MKRSIENIVGCLLMGLLFITLSFGFYYTLSQPSSDPPYGPPNWPTVFLFTGTSAFIGIFFIILFGITLKQYLKEQKEFHLKPPRPWTSSHRREVAWMPRRSISVLDLTAGQECARFLRIAAILAGCIPTFRRNIWIHFGAGGKAKIWGPTEGRGRYLFKVRHSFKRRERE